MRQTPPLPVRSRHAWIDLLRGTSVLLVIILHARQYAFHGYVSASDTVQGSALTDLVLLMNESLAPFRMQIMFLLSGFFVARSLDKGSAAYLSGKLRGVLYPYLLWSLVIFVVRDGSAALLKHQPLDWAQLTPIVTGTSTLTWFLYNLFIFYLVTPFLRRFPPLLVVLGALALAFAVPSSIYAQPSLFYYFIYFFLGDLITRRKIDLSTRPPTPVLLLSTLSLVAVIALAHFSGLPKQWPGYLPLVLGALPILVRAAVLASRHRWSAPLSYVGRHSIVFYLVHYPPYLVLAFLLHRISQDGTLIFVALLASGLCGPWLICLMRTQLGVRALNLMFALPPGRRRDALSAQRA